MTVVPATASTENKQPIPDGQEAMKTLQADHDKLKMVHEALQLEHAKMKGKHEELSKQHKTMGDRLYGAKAEPEMDQNGAPM